MSISLEAANALDGAISRKISKAAAKRTRASGTVTRVDEDGTAYVMLDGSEIETPASQTAAAVREGERVGATVDNGELVIDGNYSAPATDDRAAVAAQSTADAAVQFAGEAASAAASAIENAEIAEQAAQSAQDSLKSVVQGATTVEKAVSVMQTALEAVVDYDAANDTTTEYFWHDANGAHVLGDTSGYRNDIDSTGMTIVEVSSEDSVAQFGTSGSQIGKDDESHMELDYHSMKMVDKDGNTYFHVSDISSGSITIDDGWEYYKSSGRTAYFDDGVVYYEDSQTAEGGNQETFFFYPPAESDSGFDGDDVVVYLNDEEFSSHYYAITPVAVQIGSSVYLCYRLKMSGDFTESGDELHFKWPVKNYAETVALTFGSRSHNDSIGVFSSVLGRACDAVDDYAVALNEGTVARRKSQVAIGSYNEEDDAHTVTHPAGSSAHYGTYALIIGNGTADNSRSNALAVDWSGNVLIAGDVQDMSGNKLSIAAIQTNHSSEDLDDQPQGSVWWGNGMSNAPNSSNGYIQSVRIGMYQMAFCFNGNTSAPTAFLRSKVNLVWQPWIRIDSSLSTRTQDISSTSGSNTQTVSFKGNSAYIVFRRGTTSCIANMSYWDSGASYIGTQGNISITKNANAKTGTITVTVGTGAVSCVASGNVTFG